MSKIYNKYLELKKENDDKFYLFKCGNFYIFLDEDAERINEYVVLKITKFANNVTKCGFPVAKLEDYLKVFHNHELDIMVVEDIKKDYEEIINYILKIKIEEITPMEAINVLFKIQEMCKKSN